MSLKNTIKNYLYERLDEKDGFVHKGEIERFAMELGYLGDNAGRRLRELTANGEVIAIPSGNSTAYKYIPKIYTKD